MKKTNLRSSSGNNIDFWAFILYVFLLAIGFLNIYSVTSDVNQSTFHLSQIATKQLIWIGGAGLIILTIIFANVVIIEYFSYYFYGLIIILNIAVLFLGHEVAGAKSWFGFGGFGIQPSEFAKVATAMALAKFLGTYGIKFRGWKNISIALAIFILPMVIILIQNDTGSALVYLSFFLVVYREGMPGYFLIAAIWLGILGIISIIFQSYNISLGYLHGLFLGLGSILVYFSRKNRQIVLLVLIISIGSSLFSGVVGWAYGKLFKNYQKDRIEIVLGLKEDKRGMGYNLEQSKIAIGAGGLSGRGFTKGTQTKMGFVPEQHTDFIFCTIGEEWGFLGVFVFFSAFVSLMIRLIYLAERQSDSYGRVLGYSACCILFFHFFINIGMTIGLIPVIGIPLPFVSFGGSSLWGFTLLLFTFLRYDQIRKN
jgi:rod shape determining protein RodA